MPVVQIWQQTLPYEIYYYGPFPFRYTSDRVIIFPCGATYGWITLKATP